jgi:hypothetical protein
VKEMRRICEVLTEKKGDQRVDGMIELCLRCCAKEV